MPVCASPEPRGLPSPSGGNPPGSLVTLCCHQDFGTRISMLLIFLAQKIEFILLETIEFCLICLVCNSTYCCHSEKNRGRTLRRGSTYNVDATRMPPGRGGGAGEVRAWLLRGHAGSLPCDTPCHGPVGFCIANPVLKSKTTVTVRAEAGGIRGRSDVPALSDSVSGWWHEPPSHAGPRHRGTPPHCAPEAAHGQPFPNAVSNFMNLSFLKV